MEFKIFKCKGRNISWGVVNDKWLPSHVIFPITRGAKFITVKDGQVGNMAVIDKETGHPIPAEELVKQFLIQNRRNGYVDANGARSIDYYDQLFFIDYNKSLKKFFEENHLPIPADERGVAERMLGTYTDTLKAFGLEEEEAISPGQKAILEAKKEEEPNAKEVVQEETTPEPVEVKKPKTVNKRKKSVVTK